MALALLHDAEVGMTALIALALLANHTTHLPIALTVSSSGTATLTAPVYDVEFHYGGCRCWTHEPDATASSAGFALPLLLPAGWWLRERRRAKLREAEPEQGRKIR